MSAALPCTTSTFVPAQPAGKLTGQRGVDLHGGQPGGALAQQVGGKARPGPYFEQVITKIRHRVNPREKVASQHLGVTGAG